MSNNSAIDDDVIYLGTFQGKSTKSSKKPARSKSLPVSQSLSRRCVKRRFHRSDDLCQVESSQTIPRRAMFYDIDQTHIINCETASVLSQLITLSSSFLTDAFDQSNGSVRVNINVELDE
jgi:hypothetical protein